MDITKVAPRFNPKEDEIEFYLTIFERQLKFLSIPESEWIPYLISSLATEIAQLIARKDEEDSQDYRKVKEVLLKRYKLIADRFRQLFSQHKKRPDTTWKDFYFEIASYFEGWITELNIKDFEQLKSTDSLQSAGIVLDVPNGKWHFCEKPQIQYSFYKVPFNNENCLVADSKEKTAETSSSIQVLRTSFAINLRSDEDTLLADGIIEEFESPYASPVVFVPKHNGSMRLCADFNKLNATTVADTYPLSRMDEEAQLVVPVQERERVFQEYHDVPTTGYYGAEWTYNKVACRYYFPGMRKYIAEYAKNCPDCNRYKPCNQKPTGFLRTPVYAQRFEPFAIDLFGPLPETSSDLIPEYHPETNPSERKNRDLKPRLAILVRDERDTWDEKLPMIRFALNTAKCETTNHTAAYLQFGRELRTTDDVTHNLRALIDNDNFVAEITPYLKRFARLTAEIKDHVEQKQDKRKAYYNRRLRQVFYKPGDLVWVTLHPVSKSQNKKSRKFMPKREGPYLVVTNRSPTTYDIADPAKLTYHSSVLRAYELPVARDSGTVAPLRRRGRPKKFRVNSSPRRLASQRGSL
ncbi:Transposon Ty3-I Gag-Pol polyprotein like [Argiope bruennichi]|uniref:RNA-directed DNA polymerase n=1 Tax=Argiope bruennichi TaxID=94029 RepID=A0A8T0F1U8_ARGBR|nr:Transposon Ty3-I Gag-Pol polyprotein like [Argiope bruennichi]